MKRARWRRRRRLLSIGWLVDEDQVLELAAQLRASGFTVTVSPNVVMG